MRGRVMTEIYDDALSKQWWYWYSRTGTGVLLCGTGVTYLFFLRVVLQNRMVFNNLNMAMGNSRKDVQLYIRNMIVRERLKLWRKYL